MSRPDAAVEVVAVPATASAGGHLEVARRAYWTWRRRLAFLLVAFRVLASSLRGARRGLTAWWKWVRVRELDKATREAGDLLVAHAYRRRERRTRTALSAAALAVVGVVVLVGLVLLGALAVGAPLLLGTGTAAARAGRREGETLVGGARRSGKVNQDAVTEALRAAGVVKASENVRFVEPVARDGAAWTAVVDLPPGRKAEAAVKARESIASALAVDEVQLDLSRVRGDAGHAGRLSIWCAGRDPYAAPSGAWPLVGADSWDFWRPFPFGRDARSREVALNMLWTHLLVGAIPRMGKTFAARLPAAAAALDPYVRLVVFDGKNGTDWLPFARVAHRFGKGVRPDTVERLAVVLAELVEDMNDRYDRLGRYPADEVPEGKVTPSITRDPDAGMPLVLVAVDEVQRYLESKQHGGAILDALVELAKVGPAVGYMLELATQKPDADTLPSELRDVLGTRFALKMMTYQASDTILGAGSYSSGLDASKLLRSHKGVGILLGADDESSAEVPSTVRTYLLDAVGVRAVCERGRQLRLDAGTLTGDAAGDEPAAELPSTLAAVRHLLVGTGVDKVTTRSALVSLGRVTTDADDAEVRTAGGALAAELRPYGVSPTDVWLDGRSASGYRLADVEAAVERLA